MTARYFPFSARQSAGAERERRVTEPDAEVTGSGGGGTLLGVTRGNVSDRWGLLLRRRTAERTAAE